MTRLADIASSFHSRAFVLLAAGALVAVLPLRTYLILPRETALEAGSERLRRLLGGSGSDSLPPPSQLAEDHTRATARAYGLEQIVLSADGALLAPALNRRAKLSGLTQVAVGRGTSVPGRHYTRLVYTVSARGSYAALVSFMESVGAQGAGLVPRVVSIDLAEADDLGTGSEIVAELEVDAFVLAVGASPVPRPRAEVAEAASLPAAASGIEPADVGPPAPPWTETAGEPQAPLGREHPFLPYNVESAPPVDGLRLAGVIASAVGERSLAVFASAPGPGVSAMRGPLRLWPGEAASGVRLVAAGPDSAVIELVGLGAGSRRTLRLRGESRALANSLSEIRR